MLNADIKNWRLIDCSYNGSVVITTSSGGFIYISTNGGSTWTQCAAAGTGMWNYISISSNGASIVASTETKILTSDNYGSSWSELTLSRSSDEYIVAAAISPDGTKIIVSTNKKSYIYVNKILSSNVDIASNFIIDLMGIYSQVNRIQIEDSGSVLVEGAIYENNTIKRTSIQNAVASSNFQVMLGSSTRQPNSVLLSYNKGSTTTTIPLTSVSPTTIPTVSIAFDGQVLVAGMVEGTNLRVSTDRGLFWTTRTIPGALSNVVVSKDGTTIYIIYLSSISTGNKPIIAKSTNNGVSWNTINQLTSDNWSSISCSKFNNGQNIAVAANDGYIFLSQNSGEGWTQLTSAGKRNWKKVIISEDGQSILALAIRNYAFASSVLMLSTDSGSTWITLFTSDDFNINFSCSFDFYIIAIIRPHRRSVVVSRNYGATFQEQMIPIGSTTYLYSEIYLSSDGFFMCIPLVTTSSFTPTTTRISIAVSSNSGINWTLPTTAAASILTINPGLVTPNIKILGSLNAERLLFHIENYGDVPRFEERLDYCTKIGNSFVRSCPNAAFRPILTYDGKRLIDCINLPNGGALFGDTINESNLFSTKVYIVNELGQIYVNNNQCVV